METKTFTSLIEEKLKLHEMPEIIRELSVNDLSEIIIKKAYTEVVLSLSEEEGITLLTFLDKADYEKAYQFLTKKEETRSIALKAAEDVIEEFTIQMREEA